MWFFFIIIIIYDSQWSLTDLLNTLNPVSKAGATWNLVEIGQLISEEKVFNNIMILYMYTA